MFAANAQGSCWIALWGKLFVILCMSFRELENNFNWYLKLAEIHDDQFIAADSYSV